jgi:hypothetical protein
LAEYSVRLACLQTLQKYKVNVVEQCRNNKESILWPEGLRMKEEVFALGMVNETTKHHSKSHAIVHPGLGDSGVGGEMEGWSNQ